MSSSAPTLPTGPASGSPLALPPLTLVHQEISTLTSSMRRNQRWASIPSGSYSASSQSSSQYRGGGVSELGRLGLQSKGGRRMGSVGVGLGGSPAMGGAAAPGASGRRKESWGDARGPQGGAGAEGDEGDLMGGFIALKRELNSVKEITQLSPLFLLHPFLALIRSPLTSGPITSLSLSSLHSLLLYILPLYLTAPSLRTAPSTPLQLALAHMTSTLSSCRFPSSSPAQDELVLMRLLRVIELLAVPVAVPPSTSETSGSTSDAAPSSLAAGGNPVEMRYCTYLDHLSDESLCALLEIGLGMLARARLGEGVRNMAQSVVQALVRGCFGRLGGLDRKVVEALLDGGGQEGQGSNRPDASSKEGKVKEPESGAEVSIAPKEAKTQAQAQSANSETQTAQQGGPGSGPLSDIISGGDTDPAASARPVGHEKRPSVVELVDSTAPAALSLSTDPNQPSSTSHDLSVPVSPAETLPPFTPHSLPTLLELLRVLIALLNPSDASHTDSMRVSALSILNTALEVGGPGLGDWAEVRTGVEDEGCRYLFQLSRSDSPVLLSASLRTTTTLFATLMPFLKMQLELFLSYLIDRLTPPAPPPGLVGLGLNSAGVPSRPGTPNPQGNVAASRSTDQLQLAPPQSEDPISRPDTPSAAASASASTPRALANLPPVPNETRELMLDTLGMIVSSPGFWPGAWVGYDCDPESEDMVERLVSFLTRGVYPVASTQPKSDGSTSLFEMESNQLLCLDMVLSFVDGMAERMEGGGEAWPRDWPSPAELQGRKDKKALQLRGTQLFNQKPRLGLAFLQENGIISSDRSTTSGRPAAAENDGAEEAKTEEQQRLRGIAKFLRNSSRVDKKLLGDYISGGNQLGLLREFIGLFEFSGKSIADAMRELLETFRLPGEAQPISRITETFAEHFFSFRPPEIASQDAVYVLAYSVIMLNTDQHNPQNRKKMTVEDYQRNLRGVNDGKDFDPEYLRGIHESIRKREIILPEEHAGQHGFEWAWRGLMARVKRAGPMLLSQSAQFDASLFGLSWRPVVGAIAYAFTTTAQADEHVMQRLITGFRQTANLAGHFGVAEVFDTIVHSLSGATGLLDGAGGEDDGLISTTHAFPVVEKEGTTLNISPLSVRFGQSYRSQLATVVLFTILNGHAGSVATSWPAIWSMFQTLFLHSLLPSPLLQMEDFLAGPSTIPMRASQPAKEQPERRMEGGLLSTLSSYLLSPYGGESDGAGGGGAAGEVDEEDVEATLVAVETLGSCKLEELYGEILDLPPSSLIPALQALRSLAESRTTRLLSQPLSTPESNNGSRNSNHPRLSLNSVTGSPVLGRDGQLAYDPATVWLLETMVSLAMRSGEKGGIQDSWPIVFEYVSQLLSSAQSYSVLLIERAVVGLLRLCSIVAETPAMHDQLYLALDVLRSLPSSALNTVSEQLMAGIARIFSPLSASHAEITPASASDAAQPFSTLIRSSTEWNLLLSLLLSTVSHSSASKVTLDFVSRVISTPGSLNKDNYPGVIALLDEFCTSAGAAAAGGGSTSGPAGSRQVSRGSQPRQTQREMAGPGVERGLKALDMVYELRDRIPSLISSTLPEPSPSQAFEAFYLPPLLLLSHQSLNTQPHIRVRSISYLQRLLLSPQLLPQLPLERVYDRVLFPVLDELLKPQVIERDPTGVGETRVRVATVACKMFLQLVAGAEVRRDEVGGVFVKVLGMMERFVKGEREPLNEATESLKNVVLVMHSSQLLVPPPPPTATRSPQVAQGAQDKAEKPVEQEQGADQRTQEQKELWEASAKRVERILPGFLGEVIGSGQR